ncbi:ABC transporter substrate-binding protein [Nonomuraea sp. NPDC049486]|uniref:ABC transporter substrate-binding protein n=1 Tax=Nonomuraea sp. NPDC049486 TaxID=3155773 RepID=UPI0034330915
MRLPPVVGLVVLMAAGCGGGAAPQPPRHEDGEVRVGAIISQTGVYAALGDEMERAMRLYLEEHGGELGGRPARLVVADDGGTAEQGRRAARELIERDRVDVITGLLASPVAEAVVAEAGRTPVVVANAGADDLGGPGVFRVSFTNHAHGHAAGRYAAQAHGRRPAVLMASDYSAGVETLDGFEEGYGAGKLERVLTPYGRTPDLAPYLARIPAEAELLYAFYAGGEAVAFAKAFRQLGYDARIDLLTCQNLTDEDVLAAVGPDAEGIVSVGLYAPGLENPENTAFVAKWQTRTGRNPSVVAVQSWDAMSLVDRAAARGGDLTAELGGVGELPSPRGPLRLDPATHDPVQNWYARQYQNGTNRVIATVPPKE